MPASPPTSSSGPTTRALNLPVPAEIRDLIDQAARIQGRSRSDFMIDAARRAAEPPSRRGDAARPDAGQGRSGDLRAIPGRTEPSPRWRGLRAPDGRPQPVEGMTHEAGASLSEGFSSGVQPLDEWFIRRAWNNQVSGASRIDVVAGAGTASSQKFACLLTSRQGVRDQLLPQARARRGRISASGYPG